MFAGHSESGVVDRAGPHAESAIGEGCQPHIFWPTSLCVTICLNFSLPLMA
jgi:hypothetical protein